jgi:hypothetical protein
MYMLYEQSSLPERNHVLKAILVRLNLNILEKLIATDDLCMIICSCMMNIDVNQSSPNIITISPEALKALEDYLSSKYSNVREILGLIRDAKREELETRIINSKSQIKTVSANMRNPDDNSHWFLKRLQDIANEIVSVAKIKDDTPLP